jgi:NADH dehydrogenase
VVLGDVQSVDPARRVVTVNGARREIRYDYLILATGASHSYFGHEEWERYAPGLKTIADAQEMRDRFLNAFEQAELADDPTEQREWLTFVIVGGGPTGVELSGVLDEIARRALRPDFRHIDTSATRVVLVEAGPRLLPAYAEDLSAATRRDLEKLGVEVLLGDPVVDLNEREITLKSGTTIRARTIFWGAGNAASPRARDLGAPLDRAGRVLVEPDLSVPGHPEIFAIGDVATVKQANGQAVPGVAQGAIQGGSHAAKCILRHIRGEPTLPFRYNDKGSVALIGRNKAVGDIRGHHVTGFLAWILWAGIHIFYLIGFRNRISVMVEWAYAYLTFQRGARLIDRPTRNFSDSAPPASK